MLRRRRGLSLNPEQTHLIKFSVTTMAEDLFASSSFAAASHMSTHGADLLHQASAHMRLRPCRISFWRKNRIPIVIPVVCSGFRLVTHHEKHPAGRTSTRAPTGGPFIVQYDDRLAIGRFVIDIVHVDEHMPHRERRPPHVACGLRDADEGTSR